MVTTEDYKRLGAGIYLNDTIVQFMIGYVAYTDLMSEIRERQVHKIVIALEPNTAFKKK